MAAVRKICTVVVIVLEEVSEDLDGIHRGHEGFFKEVSRISLVSQQGCENLNFTFLLHIVYFKASSFMKIMNLLFLMTEFFYCKTVFPIIFLYRRSFYTQIGFAERKD